MTGPVVIKLGGSLLDHPGLPAWLARYLAVHASRGPVLVVGGGAPADFIRTIDRVHGIGDEAAHHLALRAMDFTAHVVASLVAGTQVVESVADFPDAWSSGRTPILAPRRFLDEDATAPDRLAHTWDVTSDSIAARVAARIGAAELVLLKSAALPPGAGRRSAVRLGLVDPAFPDASRCLPRVLVVNVRDPAGSPREMM